MFLLNRLYFRDMSSTGVQTVREWKLCKRGAGINQTFLPSITKDEKQRIRSVLNAKR